RKAIENLMTLEGLDTEERKPLAAANISSKVIAAITEMAEPTTRQSRLLARFKSFPNESISGALQALLKPNLPQFIYSSHYDRMVGAIRLDTYQQRLNGQIQPPISAGERVFVDFLEYAGTSVSEINAAKTYESLNARCESASNKITAQ